MLTVRKMSQKKSAKLLVRNNLLATIQNSIGAKIFRKRYYRIGRKKTEILRDGDLSCAVFVSSVLKLFSLIRDVHTSVTGTVKGMKQYGWREIKKPRPGSVIVWVPKYFKKNREMHKHIGFYTGNSNAVSNSSEKKSPQQHHWNNRGVEAILWHKKIL